MNHGQKYGIEERWIHGERARFIIINRDEDEGREGRSSSSGLCGAVASSSTFTDTLIEGSIAMRELIVAA